MQVTQLIVFLWFPSDFLQVTIGRGCAPMCKPLIYFVPEAPTPNSLCLQIGKENLKESHLVPHTGGQIQNTFFTYGMDKRGKHSQVTDRQPGRWVYVSANCFSHKTNNCVVLFIVRGQLNPSDEWVNFTTSRVVEL